jgi:hypothetical protein
MALYIPRSVFHLGRLLYVRPKTFAPAHARTCVATNTRMYIYRAVIWGNTLSFHKNFLVKQAIHKWAG